jgi:hypothetical protein
LMRDESRESFNALFQGLHEIRDKIGAPNSFLVRELLA